VGQERSGSWLGLPACDKGTRKHFDFGLKERDIAPGEETQKGSGKSAGLDMTFIYGNVVMKGNLRFY